MPRTLSPVAMSALMANETNEAFILLVTFSHELETFRCALNTEEVFSGGEYYTPTFFAFTLPEVSDRAPQGAQITVDNVDPRMVDLLRRIIKPIQVQIKLVLASQPDVIEMQLDDLVLRNATWNASQIEGTLAVEDLLNAGFPAYLYEPRTFQGVF